MLTHPEVRLARRGEARQIAEISRDVIEHGLRWTYDAARIRAAIASASVNVAVVREHGTLVAFGIMEYGDTAAHLVLLGVRPARQRRGLGRRLVEWLEKSALTAGIQRVRVEARADRPAAIAFYRRLGYEQRARLPRYYSGTLDAVRLEKRLGASAGPAP